MTIECFKHLFEIFKKLKKLGSSSSQKLITRRDSLIVSCSVLKLFSYKTQKAQLISYFSSMVLNLNRIIGYNV